jgi:hypothetical protein
MSYGKIKTGDTVPQRQTMHVKSRAGGVMSNNFMDDYMNNESEFAEKIDEEDFDDFESNFDHLLTSGATRSNLGVPFNQDQEDDEAIDRRRDTIISTRHLL